MSGVPAAAKSAPAPAPSAKRPRLSGAELNEGLKHMLDSLSGDERQQLLQRLSAVKSEALHDSQDTLLSGHSGATLEAGRELIDAQLACQDLLVDRGAADAAMAAETGVPDRLTESAAEALLEQDEDGFCFAPPVAEAAPRVEGHGLPDGHGGDKQATAAGAAAAALGLFRRTAAQKPMSPVPPEAAAGKSSDSSHGANSSGQGILASMSADQLREALADLLQKQELLLESKQQQKSIQPQAPETKRGEGASSASASEGSLVQVPKPVAAQQSFDTLTLAQRKAILS